MNAGDQLCSGTCDGGTHLEHAAWGHLGIKARQEQDAGAEVGQAAIWPLQLEQHGVPHYQVLGLQSLHPGKAHCLTMQQEFSVLSP